MRAEKTGNEKMRQKGTFFPPLVLRWRKPEKGQKASIEEIFEIFLIKNTSAYGKREDVRNLKMDGKEGIFTTVGIYLADIDSLRR